MAHVIREAGECLLCGHIQAFAVYRPGEGGLPGVGVCDLCRRFAEPNRGPCTYERGCGCNADPGRLPERPSDER